MLNYVSLPPYSEKSGTPLQCAFNVTFKTLQSVNKQNEFIKYNKVYKI